jgi:hypothetical protein
MNETEEDPIEPQCLDMVAATLAAATVGAVGRSMSSEYAVEKFFEFAACCRTPLRRNQG